MSVGLPPDGTLFTWFRDAAERHPEATAIEVAGETVGYRELLDLAERLATRLASRPVAANPAGRPAAVGLLTGRSLAAYAGYLAALRLGAAAVPLGPDWPVARNAAACRSCRVGAIVADEAGTGQVARLAEQAGAAAVPLTSRGRTPWYWNLDEPRYAEPYPGRPDEVAYVLFTSGSTGAPKGVPIRHRNLGPYLDHCRQRYQVGPGVRFVQTVELTFDASVLGLFGSWCAGATLVVARPEELLDPPRLVTSRRLTHWFSVPSVISFAVRSGTLPPGSMPQLRWSGFGGEQLSLDQARAWARAAPGSVVANLYGPTELTVACTEYLLPADPAEWPVTPNGTVPIGRAYPHLEAMVLADDGRPGSEGELCVRGPQRFDGYLDPEHNRGRFVDVTGPQVPPDAWYRTGDLVRRCPDGGFVHLGRLDDQVQIRGHRVELGEVESVLRSHPKVLEVVVRAVGATGPTPALQAVYTGEPVDDGELAAFAGARLPPYLRPEAYRWVEDLPRTANGKIDRHALSSDLPDPPA